METRYFIIDANDPNIEDIFAVVVGQSSSQRYSIDGLKVVVKLKQGDTSDYPFLSQYDEYDHVQILEQLNNSEWQSF
jgi:hypothetical protein